MSERFTAKQLELLRDVVQPSSDGTVMMDGHEARTASSLAKRGLVSLPAGHGYYFGSHLMRVRATDKGRAAWQALRHKSAKP